MLSKSKYIKGTNCIKSLWLDYHKQTKALQAINEETFKTGNYIGYLAQQLHPKAAYGLVNPTPDFDAFLHTKRLLKNGEKTIHEATFIADGVLAAIDILHQKENGKWVIYEVKASSKIKHYHLRDIAFQVYVAQQAGIEIEECYILHIDKQYVRGNKLEVTNLFKKEAVRDKIRDYLKEIPFQIGQFIKLIQQKNEPAQTMDERCNNPYSCAYQTYCQSLQTQKKTIQKRLSNRININERAVTSFITQQSQPLYFLDFETFNTGVPTYENSRPFQQIPFQYSLHKQNSKTNTYEHFGYLGNGTKDPREEFIIRLINDVGNTGSIFVYNIAFERKIIRDLIRDYPNYAVSLNAIIERLVDLMPIFKKHIRTESMEKKYSIKVVLPILCPDLSYTDLEINNGMLAMEQYKVLCENPNTSKKNKIMNDLWEYCKLDTWAMVRLWEKMNELVIADKCKA